MTRESFSRLKRLAQTRSGCVTTWSFGGESESLKVAHPNSSKSLARTYIGPDAVVSPMADPRPGAILHIVPEWSVAWGLGRRRVGANSEE